LQTEKALRVILFWLISESMVIHIVERAAEKIGSMAELGRRLGVFPQCFWQWARVPEWRVEKFCEITGFARSRVRPDLFPPIKSKGATNDGKIKKERRRKKS
jgi:hypothetical protein